MTEREAEIREIASCARGMGFLIEALELLDAARAELALDRRVLAAIVIQEDGEFRLGPAALQRVGAQTVISCETDLRTGAMVLRAAEAPAREEAVDEDQ